MRNNKYGIIFLGLLLTACHKSPIDRVQDASNGGATGTFGTAGAFVIFSDELKSGGGAFEYPGGDNQTLTFADTSNSISRRSIRYSWNGQPTDGKAADFVFAGFDLMYTPTIAQYNSSPSVPGRDLTKAGYTKATFFARGSLSTNTVLKIEVADDGNQSTPDNCLVLSANGTDDASPGTTCSKSTLLSSWQSYTILFANPGPAQTLASVKDFFKATFVFNNPTPQNTQPGLGGRVYLDQIQYQP